MMLANRTSRYDIAAHAVRQGGKYNPKVQVVAHELASNLLHLKQKDRDYINLHGMGEFSDLCYFSGFLLPLIYAKICALIETLPGVCLQILRPHSIHRRSEEIMVNKKELAGLAV